MLKHSKVSTLVRSWGHHTSTPVPSASTHLCDPGATTLALLCPVLLHTCAILGPPHWHSCAQCFHTLVRSWGHHTCTPMPHTCAILGPPHWHSYATHLCDPGATTRTGTPVPSASTHLCDPGATTLALLCHTLVRSWGHHTDTPVPSGSTHLWNPAWGHHTGTPVPHTCAILGPPHRHSCAQCFHTLVESCMGPPHVPSASTHLWNPAWGHHMCPVLPHTCGIIILGGAKS